jgi:hypothetical protein
MSKCTVHLFHASNWDPGLADFTIYCDACPSRMGFWYPSLNLSFHALTSEDSDINVIFYFEALCIFCALWDIQYHAHKGAWDIIYCTILISSARAVTSDHMDEISILANQVGTWDTPKISATVSSLQSNLGQRCKATVVFQPIVHTMLHVTYLVHLTCCSRHPK